jgi:sporulation protein YlmC with PRC-barrel domain
MFAPSSSSYRVRLSDHGSIYMAADFGSGTKPRPGTFARPESDMEAGMFKQLAYCGLIAAALAAPPVFAETATDQAAPAEKMAPAAQSTTPAPGTPSAKQTPSPAPSASAAAPANDTFVTKQDMDQWRASKLVGVKVYGPDQKKLGTIKDILVDHDGNAQVIVVSVGGFLGIGSKDVGVPFKAMQWRTEGRAAATNPPPASTSGAGTGMKASEGVVKTDPAVVEASQGYPDMGILAMTEQQLKSAPDFHYASDVSTESDSAPRPAATKP